ncbi:SET and MYND domain-containing protein 4 isoform X2 [Cephus cinctus]|uniref:Protein-lysine N-methyltransferase SMYD4 n=1 Tax=Cephus cinctus TaxID=211228 RepID=A0AAJ7VX20_CEPCN|nr:SET and MYND domain-containing protein 4 isoform X2 [Cephus cinctus]
MSQGKGNTFTQFYQMVYDAAKEKSFKNCFRELSRAGNRQGMIELVIELPGIRKWQMTDSYVAKNDIHVLATFKKHNLLTCDTKFLTEALFAASITNNNFLNILLARTKQYYRHGEYLKCIADCDYAIDLLNNVLNSIEKRISFLEYNIEFNLFQSMCLKRLELNERARACFSKASNSAEDLMKLKKDCTSVSNEEKLQTLKPFLDKLREIKQTDENINSRKSVISSTNSVPLIDGKMHNKLISCSDAVSLEYNADKGRYLIASRNIKSGSVLIVDKPFAFSTDKQALSRNCLHCHVSLILDSTTRIPCHNCQTVSFCSEECRKAAWKNYHRYECQVFDYFYETESYRTSYLLLAYRTTVSMISQGGNDFDANVLDFHDAVEKESNRFRVAIGDDYSPVDYKTVYSLETHGRHADPDDNLIRSIQAIFLAKCLAHVMADFTPGVILQQRYLELLAVATLRHLQAINSNAYEIVENIWDKETKIWEPRNVGGALYTTVSLVNHSCYANVVRHTYPNGMVVVRALRFIRKGSEILDCYGPHFLSDDRDKRRKHLLEKYYFHCACEACTDNWQLPLSEPKYQCKERKLKGS